MLRDALNRLFSFLTVQDPRQTRVNKILFGAIFLWIGLGSIINFVNMVIYYWDEIVSMFGGTLKSTAIDHSSLLGIFSLFQVNGLDVPDILKYSVGIILALAGVVGWQARQMVKMNKEHRDDLKGFTKDYREDSKESVAVMKSLEIAVHGMSERIK